MVNVNIRRMTGGGAFGTYYKISDTQGVKVLDGNAFVDEKTAKRSSTWRKARKEMKIMAKASEAGIAPKPDKVVLVNRNGLLYVGIVMQHLGNKKLADLHLEESHQAKVINRMWKKLLAAGVEHNDLHDDNMMLYKNKYYAIDFGIAKLTK